MGVTNNNQVRMRGTLMGGNRGYNNKEYFEKADKINMRILNTTKYDPSLPAKFGKIHYATTKDQQGIPENGPLLL